MNIGGKKVWYGSWMGTGQVVAEGSNINIKKPL